MEKENPRELILKINELKKSLIRIKESAQVEHETSIDIDKLDNVINDLENIAVENIDFQDDRIKDSLLNIFDSIKEIFSI